MEFNQRSKKNKQNGEHYGNHRKREKVKRTESIAKAIMVENFSNLGRKMDIQIHEAQKIPKRLNPKAHIIKLSSQTKKEF